MTVKKCKCCKLHYTTDCFKRYRNGRLYAICMNCSHEREDERRCIVDPREAVSAVYNHLLNLEDHEKKANINPILWVLQEQMRLMDMR
jgi:hypothetical protein